VDLQSLAGAYRERWNNMGFKSMFGNMRQGGVGPSMGNKPGISAPTSGGMVRPKPRPSGYGPNGTGMGYGAGLKTRR